MNNARSTTDIASVLVFLDRKKTRSYVGRLGSELIGGEIYYYFEYDAQYLKRKYAIPLGPELPLTSTFFKSKKLFPSFQDRIPSRENPAYSDYCKEAGISTQEQNFLILLSTIGKRGPSSFIFEPDFKKKFTARGLKKYRETLQLTIREFGALFSISPSHLQRIESNKFSGKDILRLIEIYQEYPEVALEQIKRNSKALHTNKYQKILDILQAQIRPKPASNEVGLWSDTLSPNEVEYTLNVVDKFNGLNWSKFLNSKNVKRSISSTRSYELLVKKTNKKPEVRELKIQDIPTIMKTNTGEIWVYGRNRFGEPQLTQLRSEYCGIKFSNQPYKLIIPMNQKPEIYFVLNQGYHNHFYKDEIVNIKSSFFEIRFAYSIFANGLYAEYEFKAGIEKKSVDFKIFGKKTKNNFLVELTSLRDSDAIKDKTEKSGIFYEFISSSSNMESENSPEVRDIIKVQNAILAKSNKFPNVSPGNYHIIIVDMRGFLVGMSDTIDYRHIVYGGDRLHDEDKRYFISQNGKQELIKGLFEQSYYTKEVREKIHAIGFVLEENYTENEIKSKTKIFPNPGLIKEGDEIKLLSRLFDPW